MSTKYSSHIFKYGVAEQAKQFQKRVKLEDSHCLILRLILKLSLYKVFINQDSVLLA